MVRTLIPSITSANAQQRSLYQPLTTPSFGRPEMPAMPVIPPQRPPSPVFRDKPARIQVESFEIVHEKPGKSEGLARIMDFIMAVNASVANKKISSTTVTLNTKPIMDILDALDKWTDDFPPIEQPQRYGNLSFRNWCSKLESDSLAVLREHIPERYHKAIVEIDAYFKNSFGNGTRIDYGSGHELNFVVFLCCLDLIGCFNDDDFAALGLVVFNKYLLFVRKLQVLYNLEPAGSHGVWGLDDYQFIAYIWGSAQLIGHPNMKPKSLLNREIIEAYSKDYIFLSCIQFVMKMKTGPFHEHSPMLFDVSGVPNWAKVNKGLVKMFIGEVLEKVPIVQHLEFGILIPWRQSVE